MVIIILAIGGKDRSYAQNTKTEVIPWKGEMVETIKGEFVFKLKNGNSKTILENVLSAHKSVKLLQDTDMLNVGVLKLTDNLNYANIISTLESSNVFEYIHPNVLRQGTAVIPNDPQISNQYAPTSLDLPQAWEFTKGAANISIGVLDSGIPLQGSANNLYLSHSDLNDASKYILGLDAIGDGNSVKDENGHGTHVTGIVGALTNNNNGIAGTNWNSKIYVCQVLDQTLQGAASDFYQGVLDAVNNGGVKVIIYSGGGTAYAASDETAIQHARNNGVLVVTSAGRGTSGGVWYPGALANNYDNLICVSAIDAQDAYAFHNPNGPEITLSAPGDEIFSTTPNYSHYENYSLNYDEESGASQAVPYVGGVASLVFSLNPSLTPADVKQILIDSADDIHYNDPGSLWWIPGLQGNLVVGWGRDNYTGYGRVNAFKALSGLRYAKTTLNSATGTNNLSVGDYIKYWDFAGNYVGKITITTGMIAPDGYFRWNGLVDGGLYNLAPGWYVGLKNGSGSSIYTSLGPDNIAPTVSNFTFLSGSQIKMNISEYYNVAWVSVYVFDSNGNFVRQDFQNKISNAGNNKTFTLNSPLTNNQILKVFLVDNAGNVGSYSGQYSVTPLTMNISGPTFLNYNQTGTFTANPSGGSGSYVAYRWWERNDEGGIGPDFSIDPKDPIEPDAPPPAVWLEITSAQGQQTIQRGHPWDFSLKCEVTDSDDSKKIDTHSITIGGSSMPKLNPGNQSSVRLIPDKLTLDGNYPNPFNPTTTLKFGLPSEQHVRITIYNITGEKVRILIDAAMEAGFHEVLWDGKSEFGQSVSSGIYIYELRSEGKKLTKKMLLTK